MSQEINPEAGIIAGGTNDSPEAMVLSKERWEAVRRLHGLEKLKVSEIARRLDIDRKTEVTFVAKLKDGRKFLGTADSKAYKTLLAAVFK